MILLDTVARWDASASSACNRLNRHHGWSALFGVVSRSGDGWLWYGLIALAATAGGARGLAAALAMTACGLLGAVLYRALKRGTRRPRPCDVRALFLTVGPLDAYSFPSGHTLHAVAFAALGTAWIPALGWVLWPFAMLVAASRLVLGLHYPSDVAVGAVVGAGLAWSATAVAAALGCPL